jgi:putative flippase GtrA
MFKENSITKNLMNHKLIKEYLNPEAIVQLRRYLVSGISAFAVEYLTFQLFLNIFDIQKFISNSIAMFIGFWFSFLLNRFWSFESKENFIKQLSLYSVLFLINLIISNSLMFVFTDRLGISPSISKIIIMGMIVAWNFVLYKKVIYKKADYN